MKRILGVAILAVVVPVLAQSAATYTGCVMKDVDGNLTFCEPDHCSLLTGEGVDAKLAGHAVTVNGTVKEAGEGQPRRVIVTKIVSVNAACNQTCSLYSVHERGIGSKDKPGSEGGTPGVKSKPQQ